jgi:FG-GAP repeat/SprB repeat
MSLTITPGAVTNVTIVNTPNGSIDAATHSGGTSPYTYSWKSAPLYTSTSIQLPSDVSAVTTSSLDGVYTGTYTLTVTDSLGAVKSTVYKVAQLAINIGTVNQASSLISSSGSIGASTVIGGSGTYTHMWTWSAGSTTITTPTTLSAKSSLKTGKYTLTVTDSVYPSSIVSYTYEVPYLENLSTVFSSPEAAAYDAFGGSIAMQDQTMVVGAHEKSTNRGSVYIFKRTNYLATGGWTYESTLVQPTSLQYSNFGRSVAIDGDYVVVGQPGDSGANIQGRAHVYIRGTDNIWTLQTTLETTTTLVSYQHFGYSVSISGDYIIVGCPRWSRVTPSAINQCGTAIVFFRDGSTWSQQAQLMSETPIASGQMGYAVSIDGTTALVGEPNGVGDGGLITGSAFSYTRTGTTWSSPTRLAPNDASSLDEFGCAVQVVGEYAIVGARSWALKTPVLAKCGAAYTFISNGTTWTQEARINSGRSEANIFGNTVALNSRGDAVISTQSSNFVYLVKRSGTSWPISRVLTTGNKVAALTDKWCATWMHMYGPFVYAGTVYTTVVDPILFSGGAITNARVADTASGSIGTIVVTGGAPPYTYSWTSSILPNFETSTQSPSDVTGVTTPYLDNVFLGSYKLTVTDSLGHQNTSSAYTVSQLTIVPGYITNASGETSASGAISLGSVTGGSGTYSYMWTSSPGATTITTPTTNSAKSQLLPGLYTFTVTDTVYPTSISSWVYDVSYIQIIPQSVISPTPVASDRFGSSVSVDGLYMVVGAYGKSVVAANDGQAYIFKMGDAGWAYDNTTFSPPISGKAYEFGRGVAISGDTVIVSEPASLGSTSKGAVHVWYRSSGTNWISQGSVVTTTNMPNGSMLGQSVDISGDYIVAGAYRWSSTTPTVISDCGAVFVFIRSGSTWTEQALLRPDAPFAGQQFGSAVAIDGDTVVAGAMINITNLASSPGMALVYKRNGTVWSPPTMLTARDPTIGDQFGVTVDISGDYIIVGAASWDRKSPSRTEYGAAYIFFNNGVSWIQQARLISGDSSINSYFGLHVSILSTGIALIGARYMAYVFKLNQTSWTKYNVLNPVNSNANSWLSRSSDLSDLWIAIGDSLTSSATGSVYTTTAPAGTIIPLSISGGTITHVASSGTSSGAIGTVTVTGGSGVYNSVWTSSAGATTGLASNLESHTSLKAGTYTLTVTDSLGATVTSDYIIREVVVTGGAVTHVLVRGQATGSIGAVTISSVSNNHSYTWTSSPGATSIATQDGTSKTGLKAGAYTLVARDVTFDITNTVTFYVGEPIIISFSTVECSAYDALDGSVTASAVGGTLDSTYAYTWSNGVTAPELTGVGAGEYTLTVRSGTFTSTNTATVSEPLFTGTAIGVTPVSVSMSWPTSNDAIGSLYTVRYTGPDGVEKGDGIILTSSTANVIGLSPGTSYVIRVYRIVNRRTGVKKPLASLTAVTSPNQAEFYNKAYLTSSDGSITLKKNSLSEIGASIDDVFSTGDKVKVTTRLHPKTEAIYVKSKATIGIDELKAVMLPFDKSSGAGQEVVMQNTAEGTSTTVTYNDVEDTIRVGETDYEAGSTFMLGSSRVHVCDA